MIPLQMSVRMIPLFSVDVVIGFLLEVERLLLMINSKKSSSWGKFFFFQADVNFAIRFPTYQPSCQ